jgi:hypothetical protein
MAGPCDNREVAQIPDFHLLSGAGCHMRAIAMILSLILAVAVTAAELESRVLTHYVPQDLLETAVRTEGWTEVPLNVKGGVRKGDVVRIWAGGVIDYGNGDQPGENLATPLGLQGGKPALDPAKLVLSTDANYALALLFKTDGPELRRWMPPGKPSEIKLSKDKERLWVGFNDEKGRYQDNRLGRGRRHEFDPLWMRVEVVRIIVD